MRKIVVLMLITGLVVGTYQLKAQSKNESTFGKGLQFYTPDSSMLVKSHFRMQSLFIAEQSLAEGSDLNTQFLIRRARLKFKGFAFSPKLEYKMELGLTNKDTDHGGDALETGFAPKIILDAVLKWNFAKNFTLWAGQTKLPGNRERVISSQKLQFVDRSLVNSRYTIDRDIGFQLHSSFDLGNDFVVKPIVSWSMGEGRDIVVGNIGGFDYTGRLEILPMGDFSDYLGADIKRESEPKLAVAATYDLNEDAPRARGQKGSFLRDSLGNYIGNDLQTLFLDMMFKYRGFSLMAEYANKTAGENLISATGGQYGTGGGYVAQAGYLLKSNWEFAGRYTHVYPDDQTFSSITDTKEYTFGISKYVKGHSLKVQSDFSLIDKEDAPDNSFRFRLQFEMAI